MYKCESWTVKKAEHRRTGALEWWCWRRLLRVRWTARRSNLSILNEIKIEYHWKDWCWSWNSRTLATWWDEQTHWKRHWCWESLKAGGTGDNRGWDGWHHWLNGHEFEPTPGDGELQRSLACCSCKESDMAEWLNNNKGIKFTVEDYRSQGLLSLVPTL